MRPEAEALIGAGGAVIAVEHRDRQAAEMPLARQPLGLREKPRADPPAALPVRDDEIGHIAVGAHFRADEGIGRLDDEAQEADDRSAALGDEERALMLR